MSWVIILASKFLSPAPGRDKVFSSMALLIKSWGPDYRDHWQASMTMARRSVPGVDSALAPPRQSDAFDPTSGHRHLCNRRRASRRRPGPVSGVPRRSIRCRSSLRSLSRRRPRFRGNVQCFRSSIVQAIAALLGDCRFADRSAPPSSGAASACRTSLNQVRCWRLTLGRAWHTAVSSTRLYRHDRRRGTGPASGGQTEIFIDGLSGLIGQFEAHRPPGLLLADRRPIH
jgi:hypothetical protein